MEVTGRKYAIVVGVSEYEKAEIADLRFTTNDARRLASILRDHAGFRKEDISLFCDGPAQSETIPAGQPTHADILSAVQRLAESAADNDLLLFYFAGHGNEISGEPYLLTNDTRLNVIKDTALSLRRINELLEQSQAKCKLRIFDACRASHGERALHARAMTDGFRAVLLATATGTATLSACSAGEYAYEHPDLQQGAFTHYLCEGLSGQAANDEGVVTLERLVDYVKTSVATFCKLRNYTQTPQFVCDISGPFVLSHIPRPAPGEPQPSTQPSPVSALTEFLADHVAAAPALVRKATATHAGDVSQLIERVFGHVEHELSNLRQSFSDVLLAGRGALHTRSKQVWNALVVNAKVAGLLGERLDEGAPATEVLLKSSRAIVPSCRIYVAVMRFSYYYWIWFSMRPELQIKGGAITLDPPNVSDFCTLLGGAVHDDESMRRVVDHLLGRICETLTAWSTQCGEQLSQRLKTLEDAGKIIE